MSTPAVFDPLTEVEPDNDESIAVSDVEPFLDSTKRRHGGIWNHLASCRNRGHQQLA